MPHVTMMASGSPNTNRALLRAKATCGGYKAVHALRHPFFKHPHRLRTRIQDLSSSVNPPHLPDIINMKTFAIASIIALASVASAQLDNIPSCAVRHVLTTVLSINY